MTTETKPESKPVNAAAAAGTLLRTKEEFLAFVHACTGVQKIPATIQFPERYPVIAAIELPSSHDRVTFPIHWLYEDEWTDEQRAGMAGFIDGSIAYDFVADMQSLAQLSAEVREFHAIRAKTFMKDFHAWRAAKQAASTEGQPQS